MIRTVGGLWALMTCFAQAATLELIRQAVDQLAAEPLVQSQARHQHVAQRRSGPIVMVRRGASAFAPENSLEAYAAAMDYGADGCEVDIRRTHDGVLVLFHDESLDLLTEGFGPLRGMTLAQLQGLTPRFGFARQTGVTPPTLVALLNLARQRAMLLHLDIMEPGLESEIARLMDQADAWDHIVAVNPSNAGEFLKDPKLRLLRYKAPDLYQERRDVDPSSVASALAAPGEMILVDDPRVAVHALAREAYHPMALLREFHISLVRSLPASQVQPTGDLNVADYLRSFIQHVNPNTPDGLLKVLDASLSEAAEPDGDATYRRLRVERIVQRAWAAQRLGGLAASSRHSVRALEHIVETPAVDYEWMVDGLDGAEAARALGRLGAADSIPTLIAAIERVDPALRWSPLPIESSDPTALPDWRVKMGAFVALGDLRGRTVRKFLWRYINTDSTDAHELEPLYELAAKALLQQPLAWDQIEPLLRHKNLAVRGTAILECLDRLTEKRHKALENAAPWALELPHAPHLSPNRPKPASTATPRHKS